MGAFKKRMRFSNEFWRILACGFAVIVFVVVGFYEWYYYMLYLHEQEAEQVMTRIVAIQKELYQKHLAGELGGESPYEVLSLYVKAIERKDYEIASAYFVKSARADALRALQNASPADIPVFLGVLKESLQTLKDNVPPQSSWYLTSPVSVSFTAVESGMWEIQDLKYPFRK